MIIPVAEGMIIAVKILTVLVLILAWLGILTLVAFLAAIMQANLYNPRPSPTRLRHHKLVTPQGGISPAPEGVPASVSPRKSPPARGCGEYEEAFYDNVDRFDDPEGDL